MIQNIEQTIREYLPSIIHMSLATSSENKPWVCEVHYAYDEDLNLYFRSRINSRHSTEIEENPYVSGNIVKQHSIQDKPRGVYFEGTAEVLEKVDKNHPAFLVYSKRLGFKEEDLDEPEADDMHKFYKISVKTYYLFDKLESNPSTKYELPWNKSTIKR